MQRTFGVEFDFALLRAYAEAIREIIHLLRGTAPKIAAGLSAIVANGSTADRLVFDVPSDEAEYQTMRGAIGGHVIQRAEQRESTALREFGLELRDSLDEAWQGS